MLKKIRSLGIVLTKIYAWLKSRVSKLKFPGKSSYILSSQSCQWICDKLAAQPINAELIAYEGRRFILISDLGKFKQKNPKSIMFIDESVESIKNNLHKFLCSNWRSAVNILLFKRLNFYDPEIILTHKDANSCEDLKKYFFFINNEPGINNYPKLDEFNQLQEEYFELDNIARQYQNVKFGLLINSQVMSPQRQSVITGYFTSNNLTRKLFEYKYTVASSFAIVVFAILIFLQNNYISGTLQQYNKLNTHNSIQDLIYLYKLSKEKLPLYTNIFWPNLTAIAKQARQIIYAQLNSEIKYNYFPKLERDLMQQSHQWLDLTKDQQSSYLDSYFMNYISYLNLSYNTNLINNLSGSYISKQLTDKKVDLSVAHQVYMNKIFKHYLSGYVLKEMPKTISLNRELMHNQLNSNFIQKLFVLFKLEVAWPSIGSGLTIENMLKYKFTRNKVDHITTELINYLHSEQEFQDYFNFHLLFQDQKHKDQIWDLYTKEYKKLWNAHIENIRFKEFVNLADARDQLKSLAEVDGFWLQALEQYFKTTNQEFNLSAYKEHLFGLAETMHAASELTDVQSILILLNKLEFRTEYKQSIQSLIQKPIIKSQQVLLAKIKELISKDWENLYNYYLVNIASQYPFDQYAQDLDLSVFQSFFNPQKGRLANFIRQNIPQNPEQLAKLEFKPSLLTAVQQLQQITKHYFDRSNGELKLNFKINPQPNPTLSGIYLKLGKQVLEYHNGPQEWQTFQWPNSLEPEAILSVYNAYKDQHGYLEYTGAWSLLRILNQAKWLQKNATTTELTWRLSGMPEQDIRILLKDPQGAIKYILNTKISLPKGPFI